MLKDWLSWEAEDQSLPYLIKKEEETNIHASFCALELGICTQLH